MKNLKDNIMKISYDIFAKHTIALTIFYVIISFISEIIILVIFSSMFANLVTTLLLISFLIVFLMVVEAEANKRIYRNNQKIIELLEDIQEDISHVQRIISDCTGSMTK